MVFHCKNCGNDVADDYDFCPYCGEKIIRKFCGKCLGAYGEEFTHCPKCGLKLATKEEFEEHSIYTKKASEAFDNGDYQTVIDILTEHLLGYLPDIEKMLFVIGECYFFLKDFNNAEEYYDELIESNYLCENLWLRKAFIASYKKEYDKKEEYGLKELELYPDNKDAYWLLMNCYYHKNDFEKFDEALEALSNLEGGKDYLLQTYFLLGNVKGEEAEYAKNVKDLIKKALI